MVGRTQIGGCFGRRKEFWLQFTCNALKLFIVSERRMGLCTH